jgi:hypothetical protein
MWRTTRRTCFSSFIEIRHVETGRLVHCIIGEARCLWDGRAVTPTGVGTEARVHALRRGPERGAIQQVIELVPILPFDPTG